MSAASFDSPHFTLTELAPGVYAAIAKREEGGEFVNAGLIDLGDAALAFDSLWLPQSARDLIRAAQEVVGKPLRWLVNSHYHADHVNGNALFPPETVIVSTDGTLDLLAGWEQNLEQSRTSLPKSLEDMRAQLEAATDEQQKASLARQVRMRTWLLEEIDSVQARRPVVTFPDRLAIHGSSRHVEAISYGGGHTRSDAFLYLRDEGIVFAGDLVVVETHPFMADGQPDEWPAILRRMKELDIQHVVPGHGPVGDREDLDAMLAYFEVIEETVAQAAAEGKQAGDVTLPAPLADLFGGAFPMNVQFLMERQQTAN